MKTSIRIPEKFTANKLEKVAFFGSADIDQNHPISKEVFSIAQTMAKQGKIVVNGGGPGVMEAATRGAESVNGETVAITFYPKDMPEFEGREPGNETDQELKTANYIERMYGLIYYSDVFICFKGGTGTLSEWTTAWLMAHLYYGEHKPMILYGKFWHEVLEVVQKHFYIGDKEMEIVRVVDNEEELMLVMQELEQELEQR